MARIRLTFQKSEIRASVSSRPTRAQCRGRSASPVAARGARGVRRRHGPRPHRHRARRGRAGTDPSSPEREPRPHLCTLGAHFPLVARPSSPRPLTPPTADRPTRAFPARAPERDRGAGRAARRDREPELLGRPVRLLRRRRRSTRPSTCWRARRTCGGRGNARVAAGQRRRGRVPPAGWPRRAGRVPPASVRGAQRLRHRPLAGSRAEIESHVVAGGGASRLDPVKGVCTHLVAADTTSAKYAHAARWVACAS